MSGILEDDFLSKDSQEGKAKRSPVERVVSPPFRYGKDFKQFCEFRKQIIQRKKTLIVGPDYIMMSRSHYDEIVKKIEEAG